MKVQLYDAEELLFIPLCTQNLSKIPAVGGVYCLLNIRNGKRYVGETINLRGRLHMHRNEIDKARSQNRGIRYDSQRGDVEFVFAVLHYTECSRSRKTVEGRYIFLFCAWDSRFGYNDMCGGRWSLEASQRDHERKYARKGNFHHLPNQDLNAPVNAVYLYSCAAGRGVLSTFEEGLRPLIQYQEGKSLLRRQHTG